MSNILVLMEGIEKSFPGVHALHNCHFDLLSGEVHALVGENGAGKSTLMKVLAGVYSKDAGSIHIKGKEVEIHDPRSARHLGISIIHQELNLMPHLTVAQNIFIGREPRSRIPFVLNDKEINEKSVAILDTLHLKLDPRTKVAGLTVAKQQMVEIAKALSYNSEVLIMDEPTAALTDTEIDELFRVIRQLRDKGVGVVHISHRLEELRQIADRVTVMRDGQYINTMGIQDVSIDQIISMMVGRTIYEAARELPDKQSEDTVLEVRNLNQGNILKDISFALKRGEILGFAGLVGAGRTEVARAIFGADPVDSGQILVHGQVVNIKTPNDAVRLGIAYLSEDRKRFGLTLGMDVENNIVLASLGKFLSKIGVVKRPQTQATAAHFVDALTIRTPNLHQKARNLSGGNQQKIVLAKWLTADTEILIFDEPTRGIDVGAKSEIYKLLNELARQGKAIIMISSDLPEILRMSYRIIVMCEGRITGELSVRDATQERIMSYATQRSGVVRTDEPKPIYQ